MPRDESASLASPYPRDFPSDGPLCSRHILPWRKQSWHAPIQSHQNHKKEKAQQHCSKLQSSQKAPTSSFFLYTYDLLCTERMDGESRERLILFPWSYTFASLFRDMYCIKYHCINCHFCGTSLAFVDCIARYIYENIHLGPNLHSVLFEERITFSSSRVSDSYREFCKHSVSHWAWYQQASKMPSGRNATQHQRKLWECARGCQSYPCSCLSLSQLLPTMNFSANLIYTGKHIKTSN